MTQQFPAGSTIRRVNSEPAIVFGAGRALLMQLAHPAVAQGVTDHSDFQRNPFSRLQGTLEAVNAAVFGTEELAGRVGRRIRWVHEFVVGPQYRANDPANLLWVHATLTDTALACYTTLVGPLSAGDEERYYQEMAEVGEIFGVPRSAQPATLADFRDYVDDMAGSLEVTDEARHLAAFILRPRLALRLELLLAPVLSVQRLHTVGSLPAPLREGYGFTWTPRHAAALERSRRQIRAVSSPMPRRVRTAPTAAHSRLLLWQAGRHVRRFEDRLAAASAAGRP